MSQVLYRKWRPRRWEQVVGQEHVIQTLKNAVAAERVSHANLFAGPRGTGKTTTARLLAKALNCLDEDPAQRPCDRCEHCQAVNEGRFLDMIEIDAASNTSVDDVRDLRDKINFSPNQGRFKVYIIDEVHMLSTAAFNALLKTLEEPPPHAIFVLATTEVHKIPPTVLSRCQRHEFRRIPVADMVAYLERMAAGEGLEVAPEALALVARQATGSLRDAISLLDQLAAAGGTVTLDEAQRVLGTAASETVLKLVDALIAGEPARGLDEIQMALDSGADPRQLGRQIVEYLRGVLLLKMNSAGQMDVTATTRARMAEHADSFSLPGLLGSIRSFNAAAVEPRGSWQPGLALELAFVECLAAADRGGGAAAQAGSLQRTPQEPTDSEVKPAADPPGSVAAEDPVQGVSLHGVAQAWPRVLAAARERNPQTQGLLNSCKPLGIKDGALVLGFASQLIKTKMEKSEHLAHARAALAAALGSELEIRCVVIGETKGKGSADLGGVESDGMVAIALRDLGGEIVDIQ